MTGFNVRQTRRAAPEKAEQYRIRKLFEACGFKSYNLSQARASQQAPGLPDLWLVNPETGDALWWECKAPKPNGKPKPLRPEQSQFREECLECRVGHGWGVLADAEAWLEAHAYGKAHPNGFEVARRRQAFSDALRQVGREVAKSGRLPSAMHRAHRIVVESDGQQVP